MALNTKKVAPYCGHDTERRGFVRNEDGRFVSTDADGGVHDADDKQLRCVKARYNAGRYICFWKCLELEMAERHEGQQCSRRDARM